MRRLHLTGRGLSEAVLVLVALVIQLGGTALAAQNQPDRADFDLIAVLLIGGAAVALPLRHRFPVAVLALAFGTTLAYWALDYPGGPVWVNLIVAFVHIVQVRMRRLAIATLIAGFVAFTWVPVVLGHENAPSAVALVGLAAWLIALMSVGEMVRWRQEHARADALSQAEALRRRATEERLRIARELHDVVAHNMSLISIQAGVALHLMDQRPEQARESLVTIKQASKEALVELRSILGVLRQVDEDGNEVVGGGGGGPGEGDDCRGPGGPDAGGVGRAVDVGAPRAPVPSLQRLDDLVEGSRAAGVDVRVERDADLGALPRDVDLAAYRIVQESLTNVARHSDHKAAEVRIHLAGGVLAVDVVDEGTGTGRAAGPPGDGVPGRATGGGHGITGMRERAASVGGSLDAGPRPGRGFAVRARLPVPGASPAGTDASGQRAAGGGAPDAEPPPSDAPTGGMPAAGRDRRDQRRDAPTGGQETETA